MHCCILTDIYYYMYLSTYQCSSRYGSVFDQYFTKVHIKIRSKLELQTAYQNLNQSFPVASLMLGSLAQGLFNDFIHLYFKYLLKYLIRSVHVILTELLPSDCKFKTHPQKLSLRIVNSNPSP